MKSQFVVTLYTVRDLSDSKNIEALWDILDSPIVKPVRFDSVERAKLPFDRESAATAAKIYENEGMLFVRGDKDGFLGFFQQQPRGLATWRIYLRLEALRGKKEKSWLDWLYALCDRFPILYGYGCSTEEYDAKHTYVRTLSGGGTATGAVGVSMQEFFRYLPGLYWLTIFGPELTHTFKSKLTDLSGVEATSLPSDQVAVHLKEPVHPKNMEDRLKEESRLADVLGAAYFFDRHRADLKFEPVASLAKVLDRLPSK